MSDQTFKAVLLKTEGDPCGIVLSKKNWFNEAKKIMGIDIATFLSIRLGNTVFDILADDEALLKETVSVTVCGKKELHTDNWDGPEPLLAGPIILMHASTINEEGIYIPKDITEEDFESFGGYFFRTAEARPVKKEYTRPSRLGDVEYISRVIISGAEFV